MYKVSAGKTENSDSDRLERMAPRTGVLAVVAGATIAANCVHCAKDGL